MFDGSESPILPPTPWYLTPMFAACAMLVITAGVCVIEYRRKRTIRWFDSLWFLLTGLAGSLVIYFQPHSMAKHPHSYAAPLGLLRGREE